MANATKKTGPRRFHKTRKARNLSTRTVAAVFGVSHVTILDWESGKRPPPPPLRDAIAHWSEDDGEPQVPADSWPLSAREQRAVDAAECVMRAADQA